MTLISALPAGTDADLDDVLPVNIDGVTHKVSRADLFKATHFPLLGAAPAATDRLFLGDVSDGDALKTADYEDVKADILAAVPAVSITLTGDVTGAGESPIATTLATVNATVGTFGGANATLAMTVDEKGRITEIAAGAIAIASTQVSDFTEAAQDAVGGMVDATLTYVDGTPVLKRAAITGDVSIPDGSNTATLATVATAGVYGSADRTLIATLDGKGRVTSISNPAISILAAAVSDFATAVLDAVFATSVARAAFWTWTTTVSSVAYVVRVASSRVEISATNGVNDAGRVFVTASGAKIAADAGGVENASVTVGNAGTVALVGATTINGATQSGSNTGDQTITLTGDVTGSGTGSFAATVANDAVTYAKMQNVSAASKLLGRGSAGGSGDVEEITLGSGLTMTGATLSASATADNTALNLFLQASQQVYSG